MAKNTMCFENGMIHEFSREEMAVLQMAIGNFNQEALLCSEEGKKPFLAALENLQSLFLEHLD